MAVDFNGIADYYDLMYVDAQEYAKEIRDLERILTKFGIHAQDRVLDKTTPRLIQFHTLKNAVNPPFLGGFSIFNTVVA